jgi:hypothetical protein
MPTGTPSSLSTRKQPVQAVDPVVRGESRLVEEAAEVGTLAMRGPTAVEEPDDPLRNAINNDAARSEGASATVRDFKRPTSLPSASDVHPRRPVARSVRWRATIIRSRPGQDRNLMNLGQIRPRC